jgi:hypothetical protein|tara:strand:+ start:571 stop:939 length:369 start_codon:yes stop_codon:yes gene_type:complete
MLLLFKGFAHTTSYASAEHRRWFAGEEREVSEEQGQALLQVHASAFEVLSPSVGKPPRHRMVESSGGEDTSVLDRSVAELRAVLQSGSLDGSLQALRSAEMAGKTRKGAISAIEDRMAEVTG